MDPVAVVLTIGAVAGAIYAVIRLVKEMRGWLSDKAPSPEPASDGSPAIPTRTFVVVERDNHVWTKAQDRQHNDQDAIKLQAGFLITNIYDGEAHLAHVDLAELTPYRVSWHFFSDVQERNGSFRPTEHSEILISFWVDPNSVPVGQLAKDFPATIRLVDQFNNRHDQVVTFHWIQPAPRSARADQHQEQKRDHDDAERGAGGADGPAISMRRFDALLDEELRLLRQELDERLAGLEEWSGVAGLSSSTTRIRETVRLQEQHILRRKVAFLDTTTRCLPLFKAHNMGQIQDRLRLKIDTTVGEYLRNVVAETNGTAAEQNRIQAATWTIDPPAFLTAMEAELELIFVSKQEEGDEKALLGDLSRAKLALDKSTEAPEEPSATFPDVKRYDVFISHASEDKDFVAPLADALRELGLSVWYDDFVLRVGDNLRSSIDKGLSEARYGIVVLSPHFFSKNWPQYELEGLVAREQAGHKVILPVWYEITRVEVLEHSPPLANKVAIISQGRSTTDIASDLADVVAPRESVPENLERTRQRVSDVVAEARSLSKPKDEPHEAQSPRLAELLRAQGQLRNSHERLLAAVQRDVDAYIVAGLRNMGELSVTDSTDFKNDVIAWIEGDDEYFDSLTETIATLSEIEVARLSKAVLIPVRILDELRRIGSGGVGREAKQIKQDLVISVFFSKQEEADRIHRPAMRPLTLEEGPIAFLESQLQSLQEGALSYQQIPELAANLVRSLLEWLRTGGAEDYWRLAKIANEIDADGWLTVHRLTFVRIELLREIAHDAKIENPFPRHDLHPDVMASIREALPTSERVKRVAAGVGSVSGEDQERARGYIERRLAGIELRSLGNAVGFKNSLQAWMDDRQPFAPVANGIIELSDDDVRNLTRATGIPERILGEIRTANERGRIRPPKEIRDDILISVFRDRQSEV